MLKKEFQDTLRILLESSLFLFAIPVVLLVAWIFGLEVPAEDLLFAVPLATIFIFAAYSGMALFLRERRDKSFEYMLTLPLSRLKLLALKMLPRVLVLALLTLSMAMFHEVTFYGFILPLLYFHFGMAFLSLAFTRSYFAGFIAAFLLGFIYTMGQRVWYFSLYVWAGRTHDILHTVNPTLITVLMVLVPLAVSFFWVFNKLDLRPYRYAVRPYFYVAAPVLVLEVIYMFLAYDLYRFWN